jgi:hypothetical protein
MTPTFSDEVQLAGWSESHTGGAKVTFWLQSSEALDAFRDLTARKGNTAGHRFACVLVEIGEDEQPVQQPRKDTRGPLCREACDYCERLDFQTWIAHNAEPSKDRAKARILSICDITSRKELDTNPAAAEKFIKVIRMGFMRHQRG